MLRLALLALILLAYVSPVVAARSMSITGSTSSLLGDDVLIVTASTSGFTDGESIFIKGAFFQTGTSNYFGLTKNGETWIKNSGSNASQRQVKIGEWDGTVLIKVDFSDSGYKGEGDYPFRIRYYYGSSLTADWSTNVLTLSVSEPDPTITPTPTPQPPFAPTSIPTSVPTIVQQNTPKASPTIAISNASLTPTPMYLPESDDILVLGTMSAEEENEATDSTLGNDRISTHSAGLLRPYSIALSFIAFGFALLSGLSIWHNIGIWKMEQLRKNP